MVYRLEVRERRERGEKERKREKREKQREKERRERALDLVWYADSRRERGEADQKERACVRFSVVAVSRVNIVAPNKN